MSPANDIPWSQVWALYANHASAFQGAFRSLVRRGTKLRRDEETELVHEFLLYHARSALATFKPERGELDSWLFVVFRRFVLGALMSRASSQRRESPVEHLPERSVDVDSREAPADLRAAEAALKALPDEERIAMEALFEPEGSVRHVARKLAVSRWRAQQLLESGFEKVRERLAPSGPLNQAGAVIDLLQRRLAATSDKENES